MLVMPVTTGNPTHITTVSMLDSNPGWLCIYMYKKCEKKKREKEVGSNLCKSHSREGT